MKNITMKVHFFNLQQDDFGMPTIYRAYVLIGRSANYGEALSDQGITRIYPISDLTPNLNLDTVVASGGIEGSMQEAIKQLKILNPNLSCDL